ncbi:unnamed protein product [Rhodiola kirilowii]
MTLKEGQSITRPPLLDGSNFATWKPVMRSFLKSLDEKAWKAVLRGWTEPIMNNLTGEPVPKPKALWTEDEDKASMENSKAMNAIFSAVDENVMKLIINCEVAKEAWDILLTAFEGTDKVRNSRMQDVTTKFEEMKMKESESIAEYNTRVLELSNEASALGKPIDEERLVRKVLRSLPPRFAMKVTAIEEMHDISKLKLDELTGSLRTCEINHNFLTREVKGIALKADIPEDKPDGECTTEQLAMMAQNFGRMVRKINRRGPEQGQSSSTNFHNWKSSRSRSSDMRQESSDKGKEESQCHECKGFGHIQSQCANTLMKKKAMVASFSDSESDEEIGGGETTNFVAFVTTTGECSNSSETVPAQLELPGDDLSDKNVKLMGTVSTLKLDMEKDRETHPVGMVGLRKTITDLRRKEVFQLRKTEQLELQLESEKMDHSDTKKELNDLKRSVRMLNSGTNDLNDILESQRMESGHRGLGFTEESSSKGTTFVKAKQVTEQSAEQKVKQSKGKNIADIRKTDGKPRRTHTRSRDHSPLMRRMDTRICWYCHQMGHIKLKCRLFLAERRTYQQRTKPRQHQVWTPKANQTACMMACFSCCTELDSWYFDNGCSAHMTGNSQYLTHVRPVEKMWIVTFRDGGKGQVIGCGTLMVPDLPALENTLLVKGLTMNLISISQLCDDGNYVSFSSYSCLVLYKNGNTLMKGKRDAKNCYSIGIGLTCPKDVQACGKHQMAPHCANVKHRFLRGGVDKTLHTRSDWSCAQIHVDNCSRKLVKRKVTQFQKHAWSHTRRDEYGGSQKMVTQRYIKTHLNSYGISRLGTPRSSVGLCGVDH